MNQNGAIGHRVFGREVGGKDFIVHMDAINGFLGGLPGCGGHCRDLVTDKAHPVDGESRLIFPHRAVGCSRRDVLTRHNCF